MLRSSFGIRSHVHGGMGIPGVLGFALAGQGVRELAAIDRQELPRIDIRLPRRYRNSITFIVRKSEW
jgi:hypothetical protein